MKKLTIGSLVFGPYQQVQTLPDRYRVDGADLPFVVVGTGGVVTDWDLPLPAERAPAIAVPASVTMRQARLALLAAGKLSQVATAIAAMPSPTKEQAGIEWEYSITVERQRPFVLALGPALGLDAAALDALFIAAAKM